DSTHVQNFVNYWDETLTGAANLRMEYFHYLGYAESDNPAGQGQITAFMGNPDLSPPTTGTFQNNETANSKLVFPALTSPDVVISTQDPNHIMWAVDPWQPTSGGFYPAAGCWVSNVPGQGPAVQGFGGFNGWLTTPSQAQWQAAVKL